MGLDYLQWPHVISNKVVWFPIRYRPKALPSLAIREWAVVYCPLGWHREFLKGLAHDGALDGPPCHAIVASKLA